MFGSVCWGGNISKSDRGRLDKNYKKKFKNQIMLWESHWTVLSYYEKWLQNQLGSIPWEIRVAFSGEASCDKVVLTNLRCMLGILVFP